MVGPEEILLEREAGTQVRESLARLPLRSAMVLVLRHSALTYAEVAGAMGVGLGAVGTMLRRAEGRTRQRSASWPWQRR